jgi:hypothetical protein
MSMSGSKSVDDFPNLSYQFYRTCKMAMFVTDANPDDLISDDEYPMFIERLTYGAVNIPKYQDLDPVYITGHNKGR